MPIRHGRSFKPNYDEFKMERRRVTNNTLPAAISAAKTRRSTAASLAVHPNILKLTFDAGKRGAA